MKIYVVIIKSVVDTYKSEKSQVKTVMEYAMARYVIYGVSTDQTPFEIMKTGIQEIHRYIQGRQLVWIFQ